eukprot:gene6934-11097_t
MSRTPLIGGNWKCNGTTATVKSLFETFNKAEIPQNTEVVIGVPTIHLGLASSVASNGIKVSAQNCYKTKGAFTGETSTEMLTDMSIEWVILGHSERRHVFGESSKLIGEKTTAALASGIKVIGCVGETLEERESENTKRVVAEQLDAFKNSMKTEDWKNFVVAYEPVWAIGTGKTASPQQAQDVHEFIRDWIKQNVSEEVSKTTRILYGGSVKANNACELFEKVDIDGFLVGGASLDESFIKIIQSVKTPKK